MSKNETSTPASSDPTEASITSDNKLHRRHADDRSLDTELEDSAAAMPEGIKPGPKEAPVQVRNAEPVSTPPAPAGWDEIDEAVDESFPASDPSAKY